VAEPVIELKDVSFSAQNQSIIRGISCRFLEGTTTALVGPSGGGKSTALKLAAGLLVPDRGAVYFRGRDITAMSRGQNMDFRREGAVVFQDSALWANQNLYQILELPLRVHFPGMSRTEREARIREVLGEVGYKKELMIRPSQLSTGEQKLIAFARAMLCRPNLLFLDEWTESLDDTAAQRLVDLVRRRQEARHTILLVSHNLQIITGLADFIVIIIAGQVSMTLTKDDFAANEQMLTLVEQGLSK
jgi:ABC-type transporter Mla maintaining outer membrane lipid asymmetry ATPase subunit MlaF